MMAAELLEFTAADCNMMLNPFLLPNFEASPMNDNVVEVSDYVTFDEGLIEGSYPPIMPGNELTPNAMNCEDSALMMRMKIGAGHRIGFRTKSQVEILDDGFKWRKYGKKSVKNSPNPRNYYRCSSEGCGVKKRVEKDREDPRYVITIYDGVHNHPSPGTVCCNYGLHQADASNWASFGRGQLPLMAPDPWVLHSAANSSC